MPFIAYLLFKFDKSSSELCTPEEFAELHPTIRAVYESVDAYQVLKEQQAQREAKMWQLRQQAEAGGLNGGRAKVALTQMEVG